MSDQRQKELAERARKIVERYRNPSPEMQEEIVRGLQHDGIIDDHGQVVLPLNGQRRDANTNDHPAKD